MLETGSERYFKQLCEHLGVALIATDLDLNIVTWNAEAGRMFGAAADRMIGTPLTQIIPLDRRRRAERMLRRALDTGETIHLEFRHRDAQGSDRELIGTIAAVVSESSDRVGVSICIRDITRRIALQGEVHESRKMAALGEMAGAIAHHFNNILGGVIMSLDYAASRDDPSVQSRVFEQVGDSLQRATSLVRGLLAFAQGDQRSNELGELSDVLVQVDAGIRRDINDRPIDYELIAPDLPSVLVARGPALTILQNISKNAIEAMPSGGKLGIEATMGRDSVMILISDTGAGLDDLAKSRIFEPFWSTKGEAAGQPGEAKGLGLAIAHGLAQMIGGSIAVDSKKGEGASFRINLPIRQASPSDCADP